MNLVGRAVWYIESRFQAEISLADIAAHCGVSRFHLSRAFALTTGQPVMRYVRGRRLTEAARALLGCDATILTVALDAGYGSHEAFTRAFRDQFGITPEMARQRPGAATLAFVEPFQMQPNPTVTLTEPRRETAGPLLIAGLRGRFDQDSVSGIPLLWQQFGPWFGSVPRQIGHEAYGVCYDYGDNGQFDYLCGVAVAGLADLPGELRGVEMPKRAYLVFTHQGHVSGLHGTWRAILDSWLPTSGYRMTDEPTFEKYGADFNPATGMGRIEIWIPGG